MASLTLPFFLPAFISVFSDYLSSTLSTRPRKFLYSLANESNTQTEGTPTPVIGHGKALRKMYKETNLGFIAVTYRFCCPQSWTHSDLRVIYVHICMYMCEHEL